jgi:hypothetical protein
LSRVLAEKRAWVPMQTEAELGGRRGAFTAEERYRFIQERGPALRAHLERLLPRLETLDSEQAREMVSRVAEIHTARTKARIVAERRGPWVGGTQSHVKPESEESGSKTTSLPVGPLAGLLLQVEALRKAVHNERLRRWSDEYPPGHADREARQPKGPAQYQDGAPPPDWAGGFLSESYDWELFIPLFGDCISSSTTHIPAS